MNKENAVQAYDGLLFNLKKEGNSDTGSDTDEPWCHCDKWHKPVSEGWILYASSYVRSLAELIQRREVERLRARAWRKEDGRSDLMSLVS